MISDKPPTNPRGFDPPDPESLGRLPALEDLFPDAASEIGERFVVVEQMISQVGKAHNDNLNLLHSAVRNLGQEIGSTIRRLETNLELVASHLWLDGSRPIGWVSTAEQHGHTIPAPPP